MWFKVNNRWRINTDRVRCIGTMKDRPLTIQVEYYETDAVDTFEVNNAMETLAAFDNAVGLNKIQED